jgi:hypothetical protein
MSDSKQASQNPSDGSAETVAEDFSVGLIDEPVFVAAWGRAVKQYPPINVNAELLVRGYGITLPHAEAILAGEAFPPIAVLIGVSVPMTYTPGGLLNRITKDVYGK